MPTPTPPAPTTPAAAADDAAPSAAPRTRRVRATMRSSVRDVKNFSKMAFHMKKGVVASICFDACTKRPT